LLLFLAEQQNSEMEQTNLERGLGRTLMQGHREVSGLRCLTHKSGCSSDGPVDGQRINIECNVAVLLVFDAGVKHERNLWYLIIRPSCGTSSNANSPVPSTRPRNLHKGGGELDSNLCIVDILLSKVATVMIRPLKVQPILSFCHMSDF
jgi:hypothetical protein